GGMINRKHAAAGLPWVAFSVLADHLHFHVRSRITWYETFGVNCSDQFNRCSRRLLHCVKDPARFVFHADAVNRPSDRQTEYHDARANPYGKILDDVWLDIPRLPGTAPEPLPALPPRLRVALLTRVIGCASDPGDLILDPFSGSGTTGAAAVALGRRYVGIEQSETFADLSRLRLRAMEPGAAAQQRA